MSATKTSTAGDAPKGHGLLDQLDQFRQEITRAQDELAQAQKQAAEWESRLATVEKERDEIRKDALLTIEESEAKLTALQHDKLAADKAAAEAKLAADEIRREALQAIEEFEAEIDPLRKRAAQLEGEKAALESRSAKVRQEADEFQSRLYETEILKGRLEEAVRKAAQTAQAASAEAAALREERDNLLKKIEDERRAAESQIAALLDEKQREMARREAALEKAQSDRESLNTSLSSSRRELDSLQEQRKKLEQTLAATREDAQAQSSAKAELAMRVLQLEAKEKEFQSFQKRQAAHESLLTDARTNLERISGEKNQLQAALQKAKQDAAGQLAETLKARNEEIKTLQLAADKERGKAELLREEIAAKDRAITQLQEDFDRLKAADTGREKLLEDLAHARAEVARLGNLGKEDEQDWQSAMDTVEKYRHEAEIRAKKTVELESELARVRAEEAARRQEAAILKDQVQTLHATASMTRSQLLQLQSRQSGGDADLILTAIAALANQARRGQGGNPQAVVETLREAIDRKAPARPTSVAVAAADHPFIAPTPAWSPEVSLAPSVPSTGGSGLFQPTGHHLRQLETVDLPGDLFISLDELRCAVLDARWRRQWLDGAQPAVFLGFVPARADSPPEEFHRITRLFLDSLVDPEAPDASAYGEKELWNTMHDMVAADTLNRLVAKNDFDGTNYLSRRLRTFCRRLAALKKRTPGFHSWADVLLPQDAEVPRAVFPIDQRRLIIHGHLYGLRSHPSAGLELAAFKTDEEADGHPGLADLALASLLVLKIREGRPFQTVVEYYTQDMREVEVPRRDLNETLRGVVIPAMYELVGLPKPAMLDQMDLEFFSTGKATEVILD